MSTAASQTIGAPGSRRATIPVYEPIDSSVTLNPAPGALALSPGAITEAKIGVRSGEIGRAHV